MTGDIIELRRTRRGPVILTVFAPRVTPGRLEAPSACLHQPLRAGATLQHESTFYRAPALRVGFNRPRAGITLETHG